MKINKLTKNVIMAVCVVSMLLRPLPVMAVDAEPQETIVTEDTVEISETLEIDNENEAEVITDITNKDEGEENDESTSDDISKAGEDTKTNEPKEGDNNVDGNNDDNKSKEASGEEKNEKDIGIASGTGNKDSGIESGNGEKESVTMSGIGENANSSKGLPRMMLKSAVPPAETINIEDFGGGLEINSENKAQYDGKTITGVAPAGANLVINGVTVNLTVKNLTIDRTQEGSFNGRYNAVDLKDGATLILTVEGENIFKGDNSYGGAGICVESGNRLVVTSESSGKLTAVGGNGRGGATGIGAGNCAYDPNLATYGRSPAVGTIDIQGGTIIASGGVSYMMGKIALGSAGIGGSSMSEKGSGSISISGGTVIATGGQEAAGIGSGDNSYVGSINISGGVITANAGEFGAAIGSGYNGDGTEKLSCGNISITGGNVIANGNIGYGHCIGEIGGAVGFEGGSVTIAGDAVVTVNEGKLNPRDNVESGHVTQKYTLGISVENPMYIEGTKPGHITIGTGEMAFSENITFTLSGGKAVSSVEMVTALAGEQPVKVTIDGTELEDKTLLIGTETAIIYNAGKLDFSVTDASEYITVLYNNGVLRIGGNGTATISMSDGVTSTTDSIVVEDYANVTLTLDKLTIDTTGKSRSPIQIGINDSSTCKLIAAGKSELSRCDEGLAVGVIEASAGSTLTIGGNGTIILKGKTGDERSSDYEYYAGGIRAIDATVIIENNPTLEISNEGGTAFSGILSEKITINGGKINSKASGRGQGIGIPFNTASQIYDVKITGGTVYAEGGYSANHVGAITNDGNARAVISGGSINMNKLSQTEKISAFESCQPVNNEGKLLYCTTITVGANADTLSKKTKVVEEITIIDAAGNPYEYGINEMYTDDEAKLYLWLPEGSKVSKVVTENGTYVGECTTNTEIVTKYRGNSFGTAAATFAIEGEYNVVLSGLGTKEEPYEISKLAELEKFRDLVNGGETSICGILLSNLNNNSEEWTPIGTAENPYEGTFNGNGYKITNLYVTPDGDNRGFFGVVKNAHIMHLQIKGKIGVGNQTASTAINYGMFAGKATDSVFEECMSSDYSEIYGGQNAAGIAGWASNCTFKRCKNVAKICSYNSVCGIVFDGGNNCTVEDCLNSMPKEDYMFKKMDENATMTDCRTIGGSSVNNCLSIVRKYNNCTFVVEDADYYVHESYVCYKQDGTKVTDDWRDRKIAYILQDNREELVWEQNDINYPDIHKEGAIYSYPVYEITTYLTCDKSDTPSITYTNVGQKDSLIVPEHVFTRQVQCADALKTAGTCMNNAVYYYSCENCDTVETGNVNHTFTGDKDLNNHVGNTEIRGAIEADHSTQTDGYTGDTYCSSCNEKICSGTVIKATPHESSEWKHNETEHWKECSVEGCGSIVTGSMGVHSSTGINKATCQKKAVCDVCKEEYGETINCSFTAKIKSEEALKTPASATQDAVYYYSCSMCGRVAKDDKYTFTDHQEPKNNPSNKGNEPSKETPQNNKTTNDNAPGSNTPNATSTTQNTNANANTNANVNETAPNANATTPNVITPNANTENVADNDADANTDTNAISDENDEEKTSDDTKIDVEAKDNKAETSENDTKKKDDNNATIEEAEPIDGKKETMKTVIVATSSVAGTGTVSVGAYFFLRKKRLIGRILKKLLKK